MIFVSMSPPTVTFDLVRSIIWASSLSWIRDIRFSEATKTDQSQNSSTKLMKTTNSGFHFPIRFSSFSSSLSIAVATSG